MAGITDALQQKLGPAPAWVWILGGGVVIYMLPKVTGIFGGSPQQTPPSKNPPNQGIPPGYVPTGSQGAYTPAPTPTQSPTIQAGTLMKVRGTNGQPAMLFAPGTPYWKPAGSIPDGATVTVTGPPVPAMWGTGTNPDGSWNTTPSAFIAVPISWAGGQYYANAIGLIPAAGVGGFSDLTVAMAGRGGASPSVGSRSANLMSHFHPQIKQPIRYPHYHVAGKGGPSTVHAVARSTGLHPARIMAVNSPHVRGQIPRGHMIRIS